MFFAFPAYIFTHLLSSLHQQRQQKSQTQQQIYQQRYQKQRQQQALQTTASPTMLTYSSASRDAQSSTSRSPRTGGGRNNVTSRRDDVEYYMGSQSANML